MTQKSAYFDLDLTAASAARKTTLNNQKHIRICAVLLQQNVVGFMEIVDLFFLRCAFG